VKVTPELAREWLDTVIDGQRKVSPYRVRRYAEIMKRDEWELTHQPIAFDRDGRLMDGSHRLSAVVLADVAAEFMVAFEADRQTFEVIDTGYVRTAGAFISGAGLSYGTVIGAGARAVLLYEHRAELPRLWSTPECRRRFTVANVIDEVLANESQYRQHAAYAQRLRQACNAHASSVISGITLIERYTRRSKKTFKEFRDQLLDGVGLDFGDPILTYRNRQIRRKGSPPSRGVQSLEDWQRYLEELLRVWDAHAKGETLESIAIRTKDAIPEII